MSTTTYVKEVNNSPVIFNIDNAPDMENLEALQAIRMPEAMVSEIFGENAKFADNTTCVITEDPNNTEFPFRVQFDASKITAKPKRDTGTLAGIGMPDLSKCIHISLPAPVNGYMDKKVVAPANGWYVLRAINSSHGQECQVSITKVYESEAPDDYDSIITATSLSKNAGIAASVLMPILKGTSINLLAVNSTYRYAKFYYAQGEN